MSKKFKESVSVMFTDKQKKKLTDLAERNRMNESEYIRNQIIYIDKNYVEISALIPLINELTDSVCGNIIYDNNSGIKKHLKRLNKLIMKKGTKTYLNTSQNYVEKMSITLTDEQKELVSQKASQAGMSKSEYIRTLVFSESKYVSKRELLPILEELNYSIRKLKIKGEKTDKEQEAIRRIWKLL